MPLSGSVAEANVAGQRHRVTVPAGPVLAVVPDQPVPVTVTAVVAVVVAELAGQEPVPRSVPAPDVLALVAVHPPGAGGGGSAAGVAPGAGVAAGAGLAAVAGPVVAGGEAGGQLRGAAGFPPGARGAPRAGVTARARFPPGAGAPAGAAGAPG